MVTLKFVEQPKKMPECLGVIVAAEQSQSQCQTVDVVSYNVLKKNTWKHKSLCSVRTLL